MDWVTGVSNQHDALEDKRQYNHDKCIVLAHFGFIYICCEPSGCSSFQTSDVSLWQRKTLWKFWTSRKHLFGLSGLSGNSWAGLRVWHSGWRSPSSAFFLLQHLLWTFAAATKFAVLFTFLFPKNFSSVCLVFFHLYLVVFLWKSNSNISRSQTHPNKNFPECLWVGAQLWRRRM